MRESGSQVVTYCLMNITRAFPKLASFEPVMDSLNERIRAVAERNGALLVDMWQHPSCSDPGLFASDRVHSSMRGHAVLGSETIRRIGQYLDSTQK